MVAAGLILKPLPSLYVIYIFLMICSRNGLYFAFYHSPIRVSTGSILWPPWIRKEIYRRPTMYLYINPLLACHGSGGNWWSPTAEFQVQIQTSSINIFGGKSDDGTGFSRSISIFPNHYYTNVSCSSSSYYCRPPHLQTTRRTVLSDNADCLALLSFVYL